jgi:hypothetical protein
MIKIGIGTEFFTRGKYPRKCKVIDVYTTTNSAGIVVKVTYVAEHEFLNRTILEYDIPEATIIRGMKP